MRTPDSEAVSAIIVLLGSSESCDTLQILCCALGQRAFCQAATLIRVYDMMLNNDDL